MASDLTNKYFVKKNINKKWIDVTQGFIGVNILKISGMNEQGEAVNVYNEQWITSQKEDFLVTQTDKLGNDVVIRKNVDISVTFIVGKRYGSLDTQEVHDEFINFMCNQGDIYIKSAYTGKIVHVICLKGYKPTVEKLQRGNNSFIMGTIEYHLLDSPENVVSGGLDAGDLE